jgi:ABC-type sugar transport system permease subunit
MLVLYNQDRFNNPLFYALPRVPLILMVLLIAAALVKKAINIWHYCALVYLVFIAFNPVLYGQYFTWMFAFVAFTLPDKKT